MKIRPGDSKIFQIVQKWKGQKLPAGSFAILGVPDDRGVAISRGRAGARKGPDAIRHELYKMTLGAHGELEKLQLWDLGNLKLEKTQESTYKKLSEAVAQLLEWKVFPIILGGGHDLSFGSLSGFVKKYPRGGVANIDPHLDCRPPESKGRYSSGTAFWQLIERARMPGKNLMEFGFQPYCNSKKHFQYLEKKGATLVAWPGDLKKALRPFLKKKNALGISFDMDCVQALEAPGVSALAPIGYSAREAFDLVQHLAKEKKLKLFEVMEVNPRFDSGGRTAKLAARLVFSMLVERMGIEPTTSCMPCKRSPS